MLQNIRVTAFTVSELLREGGKITPPPPPPPIKIRVTLWIYVPYDELVIS